MSIAARTLGNSDHASNADFAVLQQAADWFGVLSAGDATAEQRDQWQRWMEARADHRRAWERVEAISQRFAMPENIRRAADSALDVAARQQQQRRRALKMLALLGGTSLIGWSAMRAAPVQQWVASFNADHRSSIGETREVSLADGSLLWLNTDTAVDADYGRELRRLQIHHGEILIQTAADNQQPSRPFVVDTDQGRLRALGTRFVVRQLEDATQLVVFEGRVQISPFDGKDQQIIEAGEQARFTRTAIERVEPAQPARQAWAKGVLLANDIPLGEFIEELSRYRRGYLACDPAVAHLRVVGGYPLNQPDQILSLLQAALPITVHARYPWWVTVGPRNSIT